MLVVAVALLWIHCNDELYNDDVACHTAEDCTAKG